MQRFNLLESLSDNIRIDKNRCTFCGICVESCILDNLRMKLAPCRQACPLGVNCQGYIQLIARGREEEAIGLMRETLPFPGILGRICSQPCEKKCHRKETEGGSLAIRALKRYLVDRFDSTVDSTEPPLPRIKPPTGKKIAVVGSGPAGLMAAYDLRVRGHRAVVFDAESEPGGMLRWAIPEFRLPAAVLEKEIGILEKMGVEFRCGVTLGKEIRLETLKEQFDAVIAATGCPKHARLSLKGEDASGILHGLPFLKAVRSGKAPEVGKRVVVIGGGNVAVDAAQTALRIGAESVTLVALESERELPAFPRAVESALAEGVALECCWGNPTFDSEAGRLKGIDLQRCTRVFDACGDFRPIFDDCLLKHLDADTVIIAVGQGVDIAPFEGTAIVRKGMLAADPLALQTSDERLFLAGDFARGPSTVVEAMASGRQAAASVDRLLNGEDLFFGRRYPGPVELDYPIDTGRGSEEPRVRLPERRMRGTGDFEEIEGSLTEDEARREAKRCYSCGSPFGKYRTCWFCLPCEVECPHEALHVEIPYLLR
jgi:NADPH-dependent glutamate synthase beta subunit-like oxidoreductase